MLYYHFWIDCPSLRMPPFSLPNESVTLYNNCFCALLARHPLVVDVRSSVFLGTQDHTKHKTKNTQHKTANTHTLLLVARVYLLPPQELL
jgi:hypothetical protein